MAEWFTHTLRKRSLSEVAGSSPVGDVMISLMIAISYRGEIGRHAVLEPLFSLRVLVRIESIARKKCRYGLGVKTRF